MSGLRETIEAILATLEGPMVARTRRMLAEGAEIEGTGDPIPAREYARVYASEPEVVAAAARSPDELWVVHGIVTEEARARVFATTDRVCRACLFARKPPPPDPDRVLAILATVDAEFRGVADKIRRLIIEGVPVRGTQNLTPTRGLRSTYALRATCTHTHPELSRQAGRLAAIAAAFPDEGWRLFHVDTERSHTSVWANEHDLARVCMDIGPDVKGLVRSVSPTRAQLERILDSFTPMLPSVAAKARRLLAEGVPITGGQVGQSAHNIGMKYWLDTIQAPHVRRQYEQLARIARAHSRENWFASTIDDVTIFANEHGIGRACIEDSEPMPGDPRLAGRLFHVCEPDPLLLRSAGPTRIDLEFWEVASSDLPATIGDLELVEPTDAERQKAPPSLEVFVFQAQGRRYTVVADALFISEVSGIPSVPSDDEDA